MRIKRVEIIGFKSFCDRAVLTLETSITAVVGPNGCGKSNIVDAIRWCMGEQSAKHLRGKAMEDVIFAGSESRGPAPMAEVSLTFDDVGFSHETLELARTSDEAQTEKLADGLGGEGEDEALDAEPAQAAATWVDAEGNPIASPQDEVAELLSDAPPAIDFQRFTEVTITRRLYRDGTSQYFINKTPCRLRDITDFFLGTGVGTKAYAIIEQGRIGQIVSSRPQDRRAIIEEAAGITKFKAKKKAAEKKLDQTRQNLMRVSDIVSELDKRMGTLRRQAQKAERFRKYKAEARDIELWKASHRWLELRGEAQLIATRLDSAREDHGTVRTAFATKDAHVVAERAELAVEERRLITLQDVVFELENRIRLGDSKIEFERREASDLDGRIAQAQTEIGEIGEQRARGAEELATRHAELAALAAEVEREAAEVMAREAAAGEARQMHVNAQGRLDQARGEMGTRRTEAATADAQLEALTRRRDEATRRLERVTAETEMHRARQHELDREAKRVSGELAALRQTKLDLGNENEHFEARRDLLADEVARGETEVETLRTEAHRRTSRLTSLKEIHDRYEGFARGTRAVMLQAEELADREGAEAIRGVVADVVRAPEQLEVAVEAMLGDRLGGVLVREPRVGLAAIGYLKAAGGGRSAFVPVHDGIHPSSGPAIEFDDRSQLLAAHAALGGEGVLGRMADLVAFADGYEAVGKRLLGSAVVVAGLDRALALHQEGVTDRLVTLEGDIVDRDGVVAGGSRDAQGAGVLAQKREIRELEEIVGKLEHDLSEALARLVTGKTEQKQVNKAIDGLRTQVHEGEIAIMGHEKDDTRVRADLERLRDRLVQLGTEQLELDERLGAIGTDGEAIHGRRAFAVQRLAELEREQLDLLSDVGIQRDRLEELAQTLTEVRIRAAQLGEKRAAAEAAALRLAKADTELAVRGERLTHEIEEASRRVVDLRTGCDALAEELADIRVRREADAGELETGRAAYQARVSDLTTVELDARELRGKSDELTREVGQLELREGQVAMTRKVVADGIEDDHIVPIASAAPLIERVASRDKYLLGMRGGHVGAVVSRKAADRLWPSLAKFWAERPGAPVAA